MITVKIINVNPGSGVVNCRHRPVNLLLNGTAPLSSSHLYGILLLLRESVPSGSSVDDMVIGPCTEVLADAVAPGPVARVVRPLFIGRKAVRVAKPKKEVATRAKDDLRMFSRP